MANIGLSALAGLQIQIDADSQATPEQRSGGVADPRHSNVGEVAKPYPWESNSTQAGDHGPYGPENQLLDDEFWFIQPAGHEYQDPYFDHTPSTRAAPFPKGINSGPVPGEHPDAVAEQRRQSALIHAVKTNAGARSINTVNAFQDDWEEIWDVSPGSTDLQPIGRQAMSSGFGWGTTDRTQSFARQNAYGFDSAHKHRRYATGTIPGNYMWLQPGGRPLRKSLAGPARPAIGPDSPFEGQDLGAAFSANGAVLQNVPTEYTAPPTVNLAAQVTYDDPGNVEWY